uniref:Uncharacterized protein n=1 Tax=Anguilla anguilla TaxID=7936 RepID=A0A0E9S7E2_ANGAN
MFPEALIALKVSNSKVDKCPRQVETSSILKINKLIGANRV